MTTVAQQADVFLASLQTRKRRPLKPATFKAYECSLRNWIVPQLGPCQLSAIDNGAVKKFGNYLVEQRLAPSTINLVATTLKMLVRSEMDENGNILNHRDWNSAFLDLPAINPDAQDAPIIAAKALNAALSKSVQPYTAYYVLAASTGLRMGEMLALRMGPDQGKGSYLGLDQGVVYVRGGVYDRKEQATKSPAGFREVDLYAPVVKWLKEAFDGKAQGELLFQERRGGFVHLATLYDHFNADGIPGSHSLRRFRTTHLENMSVPRVLVDYWTGHAGKTITDRYAKFGQSLNARKNWCKRAGVGFQIPGICEEVLELTNDDESQEVL